MKTSKKKLSRDEKILCKNVIVNSSLANNIDDVDYGEQRIEETLCKKVFDDVEKSEQLQKFFYK